MENETAAQSAQSGKNIRVIESSAHITIEIAPKGFRGTALVTIIIVFLWMITIAVWTALLGMMKPLYMLYSLPFWAIGLWTFFKATRMTRLQQTITIDRDNLTLQMRSGARSDERKFPVSEITLSLVEGSYYAYSGLNRRGKYPAVIYRNEAFGFGERTSDEQKRWLVDFLNEKLKTF